MEFTTEKEVEVTANLVLSKRMKLRAVNDNLFDCDIHVYESENPYCIIFNVSSAETHSLRMDIFREDLAREMGNWLQGRIVRKPVLHVPPRIEASMTAFVKLGQTPPQSDLLMWILSRSEITWGDGSELKFGGSSFSHADDDLDYDYNYKSLHNDFPQTTTAALRSSSHVDISSVGSVVDKKLNRPSSAPPGSTIRSTDKWDDELGTLSATKSLLGKSQALQNLPKHELKGRGTATKVFDKKTWTPDHYRMIHHIDIARKKIEEQMEERRKLIEASKAKMHNTESKYRVIRDRLTQAGSKQYWVNTAIQEHHNYVKIQQEIDLDIRRQKYKAVRETERAAWVMAPPGFVNRRGNSQSGAYIGSGVLSASAMNPLRNVELENTLKRVYWDADGRRHDRKELLDEGSVVDHAMDAIRRAASNIVAYKLDLKDIFDQFDESGDGLISIKEMGNVFLMMGVQLSEDALLAVFKHFDPNGSGGVDYGEFVWAFFNRRSLLRQWRRNTDGLTERQIEAKFHAADKNGDGTLTPQEFKKMLKGFGIDITDDDLISLLVKFDIDQSGFLDMNEFREFMKKEEKELFAQCGRTLDSAGESGGDKQEFQPQLFTRTTRSSEVGGRTRGSFEGSAGGAPAGNRGEGQTAAAAAGAAAGGGAAGRAHSSSRTTGAATSAVALGSKSSRGRESFTASPRAKSNGRSSSTAGYPQSRAGAASGASRGGAGARGSGIKSKSQETRSQRGISDLLPVESLEDGEGEEPLPDYTPPHTPPPGYSPRGDFVDAEQELQELPPKYFQFSTVANAASAAHWRAKGAKGTAHKTSGSADQLNHTTPVTGGEIVQKKQAVQRRPSDSGEEAQEDGVPQDRLSQSVPVGVRSVEDFDGAGGDKSRSASAKSAMPMQAPEASTAVPVVAAAASTVAVAAAAAAAPTVAAAVPAPAAAVTAAPTPAPTPAPAVKAAGATTAKSPATKSARVPASSSSSSSSSSKDPHIAPQITPQITSQTNRGGPHSGPQSEPQQAQASLGWQLDPVKVARSLQRQAQIEQMLGSKYYNRR